MDSSFKPDFTTADLGSTKDSLDNSFRGRLNRTENGFPPWVVSQFVLATLLESMPVSFASILPFLQKDHTFYCLLLYAGTGVNSTS